MILNAIKSIRETYHTFQILFIRFRIMTLAEHAGTTITTVWTLTMAWAMFQTFRQNLVAIEVTG